MNENLPLSTGETVGNRDPSVGSSELDPPHGSRIGDLGHGRSHSSGIRGRTVWVRDGLIEQPIRDTPQLLPDQDSSSVTHRLLPCPAGSAPCRGVPVSVTDVVRTSANDARRGQHNAIRIRHVHRWWLPWVGKLLSCNSIPGGVVWCCLLRRSAVRRGGTTSGPSLGVRASTTPSTVTAPGVGTAKAFPSSA